VANGTPVNGGGATVNGRYEWGAAVTAVNGVNGERRSDGASFLIGGDDIAGELARAAYGEAGELHGGGGDGVTRDDRCEKRRETGHRNKKTKP